MYLGEFLLLIAVLMGNLMLVQRGCSAENNPVASWQGSWQIAPTAPVNSWSLHTRIPMSSTSFIEDYDENARGKGTFKVKKKYRKFLMPLLIAYKLKFFTLIPVLIGGLLLLTGATGLAGFFFALFAATLGINKH